MTDKRRNSADTRARILAAAKQVFAEHGYAGTTTRDVAARADANIALIARYFGSKERLFREVLASLLEVSPITSVRREAFAEAVLRQVSDGREKAEPSTRLLALSLGDESSRRVSTELLAENAVDPLTAWLGGADRRPIALLILSLSLGATAYRILFGDEPNFLDDDRVATLFRDWIEQAVDVADQVSSRIDR